MFYTWAALGNDVNEPMVAAGIIDGDGPGLAQRQAAVFLSDDRAFLARVAEVWPRGNAWLGRRTRSGGICWHQQETDEGW